MPAKRYDRPSEAVIDLIDQGIARFCDAAELLAPVYAVPLGGIRNIGGEAKRRALELDPLTEPAPQPPPAEEG